MCSIAHRCEEVAGEAHMQHFLNGDLEDSPSPPPYVTQLLFGDALLDVTLHTEGGKQVTAHDSVLEFRRLG